ncbi:kinesin-like protein KIN-14J [Prosopis cineraria]|uniref:kinesin-like protein KIN-14J n=1 Tax=Prosopis cineraria TaxID=364024 RepID=UPI00240FC1C2|nr:kinesin-like protein KIN-14J [Prosopis cineraria]XP_054824249.1 kinesin-like protein KIN-14J [Prosopis cineraria]XP_054824250.1 kinesin-like protein KIN-14J [Prosopis cineraria]XP_054824251.1 kinesin-like protein KIN-14J [Prosopis cineraria]
MQLEQKERGKRGIDRLNGYPDDVSLIQAFGGSRLETLVKWLNSVLPHLNLPTDISEEELRALLRDGSVLCSILDKLVPGSVKIGGYSLDEQVNIKKFLQAMDELGLPGFDLSRLDQGSIVPVLQCLEDLKTHFVSNVVRENIQSLSRKTWDQSDLAFLTFGSEERLKFSGDSNFQHEVEGSVLPDEATLVHHVGSKSNELLQSKRGLHVDLSDDKIMELLKSNSLDNASTRSLFNIGNRIMGDIFGRKNGDMPQSQHAAWLLRKILQVIEWRFSNQAESLKNQNNLFKVREEKYQLKINALETLAAGTTEENEVVKIWLQQLKFALQVEKTKMEEKNKLDEQGVVRLKQEKVRGEIEISALKQELELVKKEHEELHMQSELRAEESKSEYEKRIRELECGLSDARNQAKKLEAFIESKSLKWKNKENSYQSFINYQFGALKELRTAMESVKDDVLKTKRSYSEEFKYLGKKLKSLAEAAENYHVVLTENRKLYNEVQDLKGNIRVYCRIRPFLPGQSQNQTTIELIGDNGELVVSNPLKHGKETRKLFKFNKVFGPTASQEEVFMDTQPLIRSVLDGYNVCIFAYGQTGSGKTYTMSGPSLSSKSDWGVNYRALHDLFHISQSRKGSIVYEVGVQMVEIYNEQVRDLLSGNGPQKRLGIWNSSQPNGLVVPDASLHSVNSMTDVLELMNVGLMNRATGSTALNERSSRSHSVLTVHVRGMDLETSTLLRGCLHLVDLAGSERVERSEATGDRLKEAQHINKSLSALGDVIFALAQRNPHVPYRNSKLTQLLQSSLGGQAKTLMFVQLNPDTASYCETISTLKFAVRVAGVELGAARGNREGRDVKELLEQVASLKDALARKDEEVERLQQLKANLNVAKRGMMRYGSSSPRRHSTGTSRHSTRLSGAGALRVGEKSASDMDNCSEYSDKHSEAGSHQSMDDLRNNPSSPLFKSSKEDASQNVNDDIDLLGFGEADSEERLSDISDGGLSMGTETDGSICSIVEYTLFPEAEKPTEITPSKSTTTDNLSSVNKEKSVLASKIPKAAEVLQKVPIKSSRLSMNRTSSKVTSSVKKTAAGSSTSVKAPPKRWQ